MTVANSWFTIDGAELELKVKTSYLALMTGLRRRLMNFKRSSLTRQRIIGLVGRPLFVNQSATLGWKWTTVKLTKQQYVIHCFYFIWLWLIVILLNWLYYYVLSFYWPHIVFHIIRFLNVLIHLLVVNFKRQNLTNVLQSSYPLFAILAWWSSKCWR